MLLNVIFRVCYSYAGKILYSWQLGLAPGCHFNTLLTNTIRQKLLQKSKSFIELYSQLVTRAYNTQERIPYTPMIQLLSSQCVAYVQEVGDYRCDLQQRSNRKVLLQARWGHAPRFRPRKRSISRAENFVKFN